MNASESRQFRKDYITTIISTSGILLTIFLVVMTILFRVVQISSWDRIFARAPIVIASLFLLVDVHRSMEVLGTIILACVNQSSYVVNYLFFDSNRPKSVSLFVLAVPGSKNGRFRYSSKPVIRLFSSTSRHDRSCSHCSSESTDSTP